MISQSAGITLRFSEACAFVGATVIPSSGSISSPASGETAVAAASASAGGRHRAERRLKNASTSGISCGSIVNAPSRSMSGAALTSALSAIAGIDACPLRPCTRSRNGDVIFSAVAQR